MMRFIFQAATILNLCCVLGLAQRGPTAIEIDADVAYIHAATGVVLPSHIDVPDQATYIRSEVVRYDADAHNISAGYSQPGVAVMSVYVYPAQKSDTLAAAYGRVIGDISQVFREVKFDVENEKVTAPTANGGPMLDGLHARMTLTPPNENQRRASDLYLFRAGDWWIKFRITYSPDQREKTAAGFDAIIRSVTQTFHIPS